MGQVKLCIPIRLCGAIIGKGGQTVRNFMDDCKADIRSGSRDDAVSAVRPSLFRSRSALVLERMTL